jgi:UDP-glucose 4,6-dehydratase
MTTILVTGGCGFIGSNFINYMVTSHPDFKFINLDCMNYCSSIKNITVAEYPNYVFVRGRIQDKDLVNHILTTHSVDTIVHFAAQSHVDNSFENSLDYTYDNVLGTHILLECARVYGKLKRFVHISTDEVYGESSLSASEEMKTESSVLCPTNPYAATKAAAELIATAYYHSYKLPVVITRGNNVYGPRQYYEKVIPRFIHLLRTDQKCTLHGNGQNLRAFIHVSDVARAVETIMLKGIIGEIYNIGSPEEVSVVDVAQRLVTLIKGDEACVDDWVEHVEDRKFNDKRYYISDSKLRALDWESQISFVNGLKDTVKWYVDNDNHWK